MAASPETVSMAMFCDFENVALGVRDANYDKFDIKPVLERLLLKGSIVVKKAYCDWDRYKGFKATMHEANFELIEIPHVRQSGKNSADIRMVVDALDLCYTKSHVNTFVVVSGDSDFSPLVSKLRENAKYVIGVGVKQSTSDLLVANCDEFIFYDDLVRENQRSAARRDPKAPQHVSRRSPEELEARKSEAVELVVSTYEALVIERGDSGKIWASMLKEALKRRKPDFNESYYGFRSFGNLLEEAQTRGFLELGRDEKSGAYVSRVSVAGTRSEAASETRSERAASVASESGGSTSPAVSGSEAPKGAARRRGRNSRKPTPTTDRSERATGSENEPSADGLVAEENGAVPTPGSDPLGLTESVRVVDDGAPVSSSGAATTEVPPTKAAPRRSGRAKSTPVVNSLPENGSAEPAPLATPVAVVSDAPAQPVASEEADKAKVEEKKSGQRTRRPRKPKVSAEPV